jgi:hypothetical protein
MCYAISYEMAMVHASCNMRHGNHSCHMLQAPLTYVSCNTHHMKRFNHPMKLFLKIKWHISMMWHVLVITFTLLCYMLTIRTPTT